MITFDEVDRLLRYEPDTGRLYWRVDVPYGAWVKAGDEAGYHHDGYIKIGIKKNHYFAHRLAYQMYHREAPDNEIDHHNGVKDDNRISNLRPATHSENMRNMARHKNNKSGFCGVIWNKRERKWVSYINADGKRKQLGAFTDFFKAVWSRKQAEIDYGYQKNHGRSA